MLDLFPEGFEEVEDAHGVQLIAYTDGGGEERLWAAFGGARSVEVEEGWEERWRAFHRPVRVGPLWIGPPWETAPADALAVTIDPGRAFGTGAHATSRLCVEFLAETAPGSLLDVGCGSGVLSIAAAKLGYGPVHAFDSDPQAVEAATRNARANGVAIEVSLADALHETLPPAEVGVANITIAAVSTLAGRLRCGCLITSGYLLTECPELPGYEWVERRDAEGWAADLYVSTQ